MIEEIILVEIIWKVKHVDCFDLVDLIMIAAESVLLHLRWWLVMLLRWLCRLSWWFIRKVYGKIKCDIFLHVGSSFRIFTRVIF